MPFFALGLVVVPWATSAAGRLIRSGLGLNHPSSPKAKPAEPIPHDSPLNVPPPAQTDFKDGSFNNVMMLHHSHVSHSRGLNCLFDETKQKKQEWDRTSLHIGPTIHRCNSGRMWLKRSPLALYMSVYLSPGVSCPESKKTSGNNPETLQSDTGSATDPSISQTVTLGSDTGAENIPIIARLRETTLIFFSTVRANMIDFFTVVPERSREESVPLLAPEEATVPTLSSMARERIVGFHSWTAEKTESVFTQAEERIADFQASFLERQTERAFSVLFTVARIKIRRFCSGCIKKITSVFTMARDIMVKFWSWISEKISSVYSQARAKISTFIFDHMISIFAALFLVVPFLCYFIFRKRAKITAVLLSAEEELPLVLPVVNQQAIYLPGIERQLLFPFPEPQQRLLLFHPGSKEALELIFKQPEQEMNLLFPEQQRRVKLLFPQSEVELQVPFDGPVEELLLLYPQSGQGFHLFFLAHGAGIRAVFSRASVKVRGTIYSVRARVSSVCCTAREDIQHIISEVCDLQRRLGQRLVLTLWVNTVSHTFSRYAAAAYDTTRRRMRRIVSWARSRIAAGFCSARGKIQALFDWVSEQSANMFV